MRIKKELLQISRVEGLTEDEEVERIKQINLLIKFINIGLNAIKRDGVKFVNDFRFNLIKRMLQRLRIFAHSTTAIRIKLKIKAIKKLRLDYEKELERIKKYTEYKGV